MRDSVELSRSLVVQKEALVKGDLGKFKKLEMLGITLHDGLSIRGFVTSKFWFNLKTLHQVK